MVCVLNRYKLIHNYRCIQILFDERQYNGGVLTSDFVTGGAFSLDGVHPTARGYAFVANLAIDAINRKYTANIPMVDIGNYPTVQVHNNGGN